MKVFSAMLVAVLSAGLTTMTVAGPMDTEIAFLKQHINDSSCQFIRNGKAYSSEQALAHINKKQDYFSDDIDSTERFIELSASSSTMSKKPYHIHCPGQNKVTSRQWLTSALQDYRQRQYAK